jgi:hypothetical protein
VSAHPFDMLESTFQLLCCEPEPLAIHGAQVPGFPARVIALTELRSMLLHPSARPSGRDRALEVLVERAQREGGRWTIGLAGVLLPGLRRNVASVCRRCPAVTDDVQADALAGLIEAVAEFDVTPGRIAGRLVWAAAGRARRRADRELAGDVRRGELSEAGAPRPPWGHPDLVLVDAVAAGVITTAEAELIGDTRVGGEPVPVWAAARGLADGTVRMRRHRAERRLVAWLRARVSEVDA